MFLLVFLGSPAQAHPTLLETLPRAGYGYSESPVEIGLVFDEPVSIQRLTVSGQARGLIATSEPSRSPEGTKVTVRPDEPLREGNYTVRWQITAEDGDTVDGTFGFGVGVKSATSEGATGSADTVDLGGVALLRWVLFTGFSVALGGLLGDVMVKDRARRARQGLGVELTPPPPWIVGGSILGLGAVGGLVLTQTGSGSVLSEVRRLPITELTESEAGWILLVEAVGFSVAGLASWRRSRPAVLFGLISIAVAEAWRSHLHAAASWLGSATIGIHFLITALWVGVLIHVVRTALRWREDCRQVVALFRRYASYALTGYIVVIATGTVAAVLVLPSSGALTSTTYGRVLLIKLGLVAVVSILALAARRGLYRSIGDHRWGGLRFARFERVGLVAVVGVTGLLTAVAPAPASRGSTFPPPISGPAVYVGDLAGQVSTGLIASDGQIQLRLHVPESSPGDVQTYRVRGQAVSGDGESKTLKLRTCGPGCFASPITWQPGQTTLDLTVRAAGWDGGSLEIVVPWPPRDGRPAFRRMLSTMAKQSRIRLTERVTSNSRRPEGMSSKLRLTGAELLREQPYRSGIVDGLAVLNRTQGRTELGFALPAEAIFVRMTLDSTGRILTEQISTPNHLVTRTYAYR